MICHQIKKIATMICLLWIMPGCIPVDMPASVGYLTAPAVEGMQYETETQSGLTGKDGSFYYLPGETITFSLGKIVLPTIEADAIITPLDFVGTDLVNNQAALNIARFLQSLDADHNPDNGVVISQATRDMARKLAFDFIKNQIDFNSESELEQLLLSLGFSMLERAIARQHLELSLSDLFSGKSFSTIIKDGLSENSKILTRGQGFLSEELAGQCYQYITWIYGVFPLVIDICYEGDGAGTVTVNQIKSQMLWSVTRETGVRLEIAGMLGGVTYIHLDRLDNGKPLLNIERMPIDIAELPSLISINTIAGFFLLGSL